MPLRTITQIDSHNRNNNKLRFETAILARNSIFKGIYENRRCFVIGNGSSLTKQNLNLLKNEITFVMNAFWKHPIISKTWQPTYYCFADPRTFDGSIYAKNFFSSLHKNIKVKYVIRRQKLLPLDSTYYVMFEDSNDEIDRIDFTHAVLSVQSTSQLAIELAIYMGCNPIYLLGMDHDFLAHKGLIKHFYTGLTIENHPDAHDDISDVSYRSEIESCLRLWKKYELIKQYAIKNKINIYNATYGGYLDVFPRINYRSIKV